MTSQEKIKQEIRQTEYLITDNKDSLNELIEDLEGYIQVANLYHLCTNIVDKAKEIEKKYNKGAELQQKLDMLKWILKDDSDTE